MDAVAASDHRREFELPGATRDNFTQVAQILEQEVRRSRHLHREGGVENIG